MPYDYYGWPRYVSAAERREKAQQAVAKLKKQGKTLEPVVVEGRSIASSFWGKAWCSNLESYSDYSNRLDRGRTYARNGSVVDLKIGEGEVRALVQGSSLYTVGITIKRVSAKLWASICLDCSRGIDSLVDLLRGSFSKGVMERLCRQREGLFPSPQEIDFRCSCPDYASMCKHVAAVLYGVGARLDAQPELLFVLRQVDSQKLISAAGRDMPLGAQAPAAEKLLDGADLSELFGIELAPPPPPARSAPKPRVKGRSSLRGEGAEPLPAPAPKPDPAAARRAPPAPAKGLAPSGHPKGAPQEHPKGAPQEHPKGAPQEHPKGAPQEHPKGAPQEHPKGAPQEHPVHGGASPELREALRAFEAQIQRFVALTSPKLAAARKKSPPGPSRKS